jgi:hypothetical protein
MYKTDRSKYETTARSWTQKYAMGWRPISRTTVRSRQENIMGHCFLSICCWLCVSDPQGSNCSQCQACHHCN